MTTSTALLELRHVTKIFPGEVPVTALTDIHFQLPASCFTALVGVSGSGKTTLLNLASGLDTPSQGEIWIHGENITRYSEKQLSLFRRNHLGFVFQSYNLLPTLTAVENVEFTLLIQGKAARTARERALQCLDDVGLSDRANHFPKELSGGQQQRVAVARSLATQPKLILADEPTANLDSVTAEKLIELFQTLNQKQGVSFLFSTHDRDLIQSVQSVITLKNGQIASIKNA